MKRLSRQTEEIENGGGNVDDACDPRYTNWLAYGARRRNDKWDSHILFVDEQRVRKVARMLSECFSMIAKYDEQRVLEKVPLT